MMFNYILGSFEDGRVEMYDMRNFQRVLNFQAHKKATTSVTFSNQQQGLFATSSLDCHVKVWDGVNTTVDSGNNDIITPDLLMEKFVKKSTGELFVCKFADDLDYTIATGGAKSSLFIWELEESQQFCHRYGLKYEEEKVRNLK